MFVSAPTLMKLLIFVLKMVVFHAAAQVVTLDDTSQNLLHYIRLGQLYLHSNAELCKRLQAFAIGTFVIDFS